MTRSQLFFVVNEIKVEEVRYIEDVKSSIKIIKRKRDEDSNDLKASEEKTPVEPSTREIVSTVKSWIAELQQRKSVQRRSFSQLPVIATDPASQNS